MKNQYELMIEKLESEGMTTSDAQGVADVHFAQANALLLLNALERIVRHYSASDDLLMNNAIRESRGVIEIARGLYEEK